MLTAKFVTKVPQGYAQLDRVGQAALVGAEAVGSYEETAAYIRASPPLVARHAEGALKRATDHGIEIDKDNLVYTIEKDSWGNCMVTVFGKQVRTP